MDNQDLTNRINELESKLAFQEAGLEELNKVIIEQQQIISKLEFQYKSLIRKLSELPTSNLASFDQQELPPHY